MIAPTAPPPPSDLMRRWREHGQITDERIGWSLDRAASQWGSRQAVVDGRGRYTFADAKVRADAISHALVSAGVGGGDVVTWILPNRIEAVTTAAAIWRIGAVSNPIVPIYREHELSFILDQLRPAAVIASDRFRSRDLADEVEATLSAIGHVPKLRLLDGAGIAGWSPIDELETGALPRDVVPASADDVCLVLYTSGTTSVPKGAMHTSQTLLQEVRSMAREWALTWNDVMFMASPLTHITGILQGLIVPVSVGARSVLMETWDPARAVDLIEAERATYIAGGTPFLQGVVEEYAKRPGTAPALRQFCSGGAAVPPHLIEEAEHLGFAAYRAWGMTEFPTTTLASERDPLERRARTDGHIAEACEVEAVDEDHHPAGRGREGELRVRGPERMVGYVDGSLNGEVLDDAGWFYTGDVGVVDEDGYVTITGRIKDIINRGGEKFSARDIEDLLSAHPAVAEVAVVGLPDPRLGERVGAAVVVRPGARTDDGELRAYLEARRVARQKIPEEFTYLPELPRTPSGKVQKFRLLKEWA